MDVGKLIVALNEAGSSEELRVVLGRALGDPELQIAYWLPTHAVWVDDGGRRMEVPEGGDGASVIERETGPAYIWADLNGASPQARLEWAVLYASRAVATPTGVGGALTLEGLLEAGDAQGLVAPPGVSARS